MMAGNPNWWSMNSMHSQQSSNQLSNSSSVYGSSISSNPSQADEDHHDHPSQDFPVRSWSQLLMGGMGGNNEEERFSSSLFQQQKKIENWEEQVFLNLNPSFTRVHPVSAADVKQEDDVVQSNNTNTSCQLYNSHLDHDEFQSVNTHSNCNWPPINHHHHQVGSIPVSSPTSCITNLGNNFLNFSGGKTAVEGKNNQRNQDHSAESNSTGTGGVSKKARVQHSSAQPALKVRKEKLGDRITALHQLVSPFGKTDTASVLSEAIGYIGFLQGQIEALSSPYMRNAPGNTGHHQHSVQERNCLFPEEPTQDSQSRGVKDLRSRGLCLVPISCTQHVANDNGADYWAPAALGGGF